MRVLLGLTMTCAVITACMDAQALTPGVTAKSIKFGQSAAYAGPASALGSGMRDGLNAAFAEINASGGIAGRNLELVGYDDGYEPEKAIANTQKLIGEDQVFALIGEVGTPTSKAVVPIAQEAKVPFVGPFTGAEFLRNPFTKGVVNVRASYFQETEALVERLTTDLGHTKIAAFYQNDSYGKAGLAGIQRALDKRGMTLAGEGTYERNTTAVKGALLSLRKAQPESIIMIGAYKPVAEFIKLAGRMKIDAVFANVSFVGSKALSAELGDAREGVLISQVVPFPWDADIPVVAQYQKAMAAYQPDFEPGFVTLEGYIVGRLAIEALQRMNGEITRASFVDTIHQSGAFDMGGVSLEYGPQDSQGMEPVFLTRIKADGSFEAVDRL